MSLTSCGDGKSMRLLNAEAGRPERSSFSSARDARRRRVFYLCPAREGIEIRRSVSREIVASQPVGRVKNGWESDRMYRAVPGPRGQGPLSSPRPRSQIDNNDGYGRVRGLSNCMFDFMFSKKRVSLMCRNETIAAGESEDNSIDRSIVDPR